MESVKKINNIRYLDEKSQDFFGWQAYLSVELEGLFETQLGQFELVRPLSSAVEYALFSGGKRIRPLLALMLCKDLGGNVTALSEVVFALELLHCASLIHDDLPALDNDDVRRGKPACHKAYAESTAILAGDILPALAQKMLLSSSFSVARKLKFSAVIAQAYIELCNGQQLDLLDPMQRGELENIHRLKTGGLFKAATLFSAIATDQTEEFLELFADLGLFAGLYFQIVDDYLDVLAQPDRKGRLNSSDLRNQKETFATFSDQSFFTKKLRLLEESLENKAAEISKVLGLSKGLPSFWHLFGQIKDQVN